MKSNKRQNRKSAKAAGAGGSPAVAGTHKKADRKRKSSDISTSEEQNGKSAKMEVEVALPAGAETKKNLKRRSTEVSHEEAKPKMKKDEEVSTPSTKSHKRLMRKKNMVAVSKKGLKEEPKDDTAKATLSLDYLKLWKNDRKSWKFLKLRQQWLNENMLIESKVPDNMFPVYLQYMGGSAKRVKQYVVKKAEGVLKELEEDESKADSKDTKYNRARMIIQSLDNDDVDFNR